MPTILLTAWTFIKRLNLSQIALVVAVGFALFYRVSLHAEQRHAAKVQERVNELRYQLDAITAKRNEQAETTKGSIAKADEGNKSADRVAKRIEAAPLPGNCATPPAIMGSADL